jgi:hypothetical protein
MTRVMCVDEAGCVCLQVLCSEGVRLQQGIGKWTKVRLLIVSCTPSEG